MKQDEILSYLVNKKVFINPYSQDALIFSLCEFLISLQRRNSIMDFKVEHFTKKCDFFLKNLKPIEPWVKDLLENYKDYMKIDSEFKPFEEKNMLDGKFKIPKLVYPQTISYVKKKSIDINKEYSNLNIIELGPWMGSISDILNRYIMNHKIHVYDQFIWQDWMHTTCLELDHPNFEFFEEGDSFLETFKKLVQPRDHVKLYECDILKHDFEYLSLGSVILVIQDFTDDYDSMTSIWNKLKSKLIPNESILISPQFGNLNATGLLKFHYEYKSELIPLDRPQSTMRSFLYRP